MSEAILEFGNSHVGEIYRKTVVVVLFNPKTNKFLYCDWPEYGLCCLISGGVEEGEDYLQAATREILEETGYKDIEILEQLGNGILTHYYMAKKNEYRVKDIKSYLVIIKNNNSVETNLELDEQFLLKEATYDDLLELMRGYKNADGGGLEDHIEILERGKIVLQKRNLL